MSFKKAVGLVLKLLLTAVIVFFLFRQISHHWQEIKDFDWEISWLPLIGSILVGLATFLIMASNWQSLIAGFGHRISLLKSFRIFYLSDMGRYIPGKIWPLMGILYMTKKEGVPPEQATASFVLIQLFAIPASFLLFALAVQFEPRILVDQVALLGEWSAWLFTACLLIGVVVLVLWPKRLLSLLNVVLRRFSRPEIVFELDKKVALQLFVRYSLGWFMYGLAFYLFLEAFAPEADIRLIAAVGVFNAAYQIGYLALFAPGGFGPRELVMGFMLAPFLGPVAPAIAIMARLWAIIVEVTAALIALMIRK
ncbi:MAG TPA: lysylphosphatidylglycerol synthase transmembrane domain-containing protein [candidate division Zixibacteria bacterium]|nr:lysylphosphatidylglycerol synthase transmembrane domain-containing protein [candidate division Zixibacteria bacterium]